MKIVCSGHLVRHPAGGHIWHHLQYLTGLRRLGHEVVYAEQSGWRESCYDPVADVMSDDPRAGLSAMVPLFEDAGIAGWWFLTADGSAHGGSHEELADRCREADLYLNLSNMNAISETRLCRRRALVDTDPVFTQLAAHGLEDPATYDVRFTFGENVGRPGCDMPTGGLVWLPTRQPVVLDLWPVEPVSAGAPLTTVTNWTAYDAVVGPDGRRYGQKDVEFERFITFPHELGRRMEIAVHAAPDVIRMLHDGGWSVVSPLEIAATTLSYQAFLRRSLGEFSAAKHAYVTTNCGWFSDRTAAYLASGRPAIVQDTGFSSVIPAGEGLLPFRSHDDAVDAVKRLDDDTEFHARAARQLAEAWFDSSIILSDLLSQAT